jgi:hypothetical protein
MPILINDTSARAQYTATASQTVFTVPFEFFANADLKVYRGSTLQTLTTHYTVTGAGVTGGGSITLVTGASAGEILTIVRDVPVSRTTDFPTSGPFNVDALNTDLDRLTAMVQQQETLDTRSLRIDQFDTPNTLNALPSKTSRAGRILSFDADGQPSTTTTAFPEALTATNYIRVNSGGTAYELRAPASVRSDIGADNASNLTSGTVADARLPSTIDGKTLTNVTISSGAITGITDLAIADGGTGASSASAARNNLGLAIGTDVQAYDPQLADIAGLTPTDNNFIVGNGTNFVTESGATARASLGLTIGTDVQAYDAQLADIAGLTPTDNNFIVGNGTNFVTESGSTARTSLGLGTIATQDANNVSITGGSISGVTFTQTTPLTVPGTASATGEIRLAEDTDNGTNYVGLKAPASISADVSWTLPAADGSSGQFLSTNGSGVLSWSSPAGAGDVVGPASATDNALVRFDGTSGKLIQNSGATLSDTGVLQATEVSTDTISEKTAAAGVTIDGVLLKDNAVNTDTINEKTAAAGVTIDSVLLKDGGATLTAPLVTAAGTAGAPSITTTGDTNTGIFFPAADTVAITAAGTEDFRIGPSGQIGLQGANYGTSGQVLTSNGSGAAPSWQAVGGGFAAGTAMLFVQTSAPTGWTKSTTHDNKALRVVSGAASSGGSVAFTTAFASQTPAGTVGSTTLTTAQIPSHSHTINTFADASGQAYASSGGGGSGSTGSTGGGGSHNHSFTGTAINLAVQYVDTIIATKD